MDSQDGGLVLMMKSIMIMTIHHQVHTRHIAVHRIIQATAQEAAVIHQRAILPENIIVVVYQKAVKILRATVRTAIAIPVAALQIQEDLQAAAPVQRNIIMIHMMMVMMMSIWMETMMMTDTTAMMIMLPVLMMLLMTMMRTGKIVGGVLICHGMDTVEMKAFHMMENREDAAVARATVGMIMMAKSKEGGQSGAI